MTKRAVIDTTARSNVPATKNVGPGLGPVGQAERDRLQPLTVAAFAARRHRTAGRATPPPDPEPAITPAPRPTTPPPPL